MNLKEFLSRTVAIEWWQGARSFCFVTKDVPSIFFIKLFERLVAKGAFSSAPRVIAVSDGTISSLQAMLQQSMLGLSEIYFLGDPFQGEKSEKKRSELEGYLSEYTGPHTILWCTASIPKGMDKDYVIVLDDAVDEKLLSDLVAYFDLMVSPAKKSLLGMLISSFGTFSLDTACHMLDYSKLISLKGQTKDDIIAYMNRLLPSDISLFTLSDYFFSARSTQFFQLWKAVNEQYPDVFWVTYWSDQVWRAHNVLYALDAKDLKAARLASTRLPFSFLRQHTRRYTYHYFAQAHAFLYETDFAIKTGSSFCSMDLFFARHFARGFDL